ncbi:MAG: substrate-binding domain-containing protein [Hyphomicrobiales bacterium]|nr:substrate-binding domain-containing protein [Hyphomicrobiales bacterium]
MLDGLLPRFQDVSGCTVAVTYEIVSRIRERLLAGERPDLVLLPKELLDEIEGIIPFRARSRRVLARTGIGVIVRDSHDPFDLSDEADVRSLLQQARVIALADPRTPSGRALDRLLGRLGLADELAPRLIRKGAIHGGGELVAAGEADLGLYLVSEVQHIAGTRVAGLLPPSLQQHVVYATAIPERSPDAAMALIAFLTAPEQAGHWRGGGFEPAA